MIPKHDKFTALTKTEERLELIYNFGYFVTYHHHLNKHTSIFAFNRSYKNSVSTKKKKNSYRLHYDAAVGVNDFIYLVGEFCILI